MVPTRDEPRAFLDTTEDYLFLKTEYLYRGLTAYYAGTYLHTDDAIRNALDTAAKTIRHIDWFEVAETRGHVVGGKVAHFQVTLKIGFRLD